MIFSPESEHPAMAFENPFDFHLICLFPVITSVRFPEATLGPVIAASLRMKKEVLLLMKPEIPAIDRTRRWEVGDHSIWLTPRSLSVISRELPVSSKNLDTFRKFLISYKP